jgi:hypothetical protein
MPSKPLDEDALRLRQLYRELTAVGVSPKHISQCLGYSGSNGMRDMRIFAEGGSLRMTLRQGCDALETELQRLRVARFRVVESDAEELSDLSDSDTGDLQASASADDAASSHESRERAADAPVTFGRALAIAVASFKRKDAVPEGFCKTPLPSPPPEGAKMSLSQWRRLAADAGAYGREWTTKGNLSLLSADRIVRGDLLARAVTAAWSKQGSTTAPAVRVWMMDGAGFVVFEMLKHLSEKWSDAELDARLVLTLVDRVTAMNDYHAWAIPCATVLRGSVHAIVANPRIVDATDPPELPHIVYFNYSTTAARRAGVAREGYEVYRTTGASCDPGATYSTHDCLTETVNTCIRLKPPSEATRLVVSFPATRGGAATARKLTALSTSAGLEASLEPSPRKALLTFVVVKPEAASPV